MTILPIIQPDNPILRQKAARITEFDDSLRQLADDMVETLINAPGVGLAAPQVAVGKRLIVVRLPDDEDSKAEYGEQAGVLYAVANPRIIRHSRKTVEGIEACLSIPGYFGEVERYETVVVSGQDLHGKPFHLKAKGWLARVFQHEIDHLDGQLYVDIAKDVWQQKDEAETDAPATETDEAS